MISNEEAIAFLSELSDQDESDEGSYDFSREVDDPDPDDEEMEVTPPDVIAVLGFDPKDLKYLDDEDDEE
ncbi:MAG: hypothetical protein LBQ00_07810 [Syntrophobacterales bacterium]|nr:hypothetical protein [Syntrophobacterales bacterium]